LLAELVEPEALFLNIREKSDIVETVEGRTPGAVQLGQHLDGFHRKHEWRLSSFRAELVSTARKTVDGKVEISKRESGLMVDYAEMLDGKRRPWWARAVKDLGDSHGVSQVSSWKEKKQIHWLPLSIRIGL